MKASPIGPPVNTLAGSPVPGFGWPGTLGTVQKLFFIHGACRGEIVWGPESTSTDVRVWRVALEAGVEDTLALEGL